MCVVSMIGDHFNDKWEDDYKKWFPNINQPTKTDQGLGNLFQPNISREEFENLKKEVEEMKLLLKRAKIYDEANNEPNCELEEKMKFLRQIATAVGVDLDEVFKK